jgi:hypothetical protein
MTIPLNGADTDGLLGLDGAELLGIGSETVALLPGVAFYVAEIQSYLAATTVTIDYWLAWGCGPWGTLSMLQQASTATSTIRASDSGYRTAPTDAGGPVPYPPLIQEAFAVDRAVNLDLSASNIGASWGSVELSNADRSFDTVATTQSNDGRPVTILRGAKTFDGQRGLLLDPSYSSLYTVFAGVSTAWSLTDTALVVPLRDASYWMEQPVQSNLYSGSGTYEGPAELTGTTKPKTRGTAFNVSPVLIDASALIYQYTDGPGTVVTLYEGAYPNRTLQGDTTDLYTGSTTSGLYRTDNSRGLFQLGNTPTGQITCDCTGAFPVSGMPSSLVNIARYLLVEDLGVPATYVDPYSFGQAAHDYPFPGGVHFAAGEDVDGITAVDRVLSGLGGMLFPARDGTLHCLVLTAPSVGATPVAVYSIDNTVSVTPAELPGSLWPPPFRIRVGHKHNYTTQTSGLLGAATSAQKQWVAQADRYATTVSSAVQTAYARPNDHDPIGGSLTFYVDALAVSQYLMRLWGVRRRLYAVVVPVDLGIQREIGDIVRLVWPMDDLSSGALGTIVGDSFRSNDATMTLKVLV